MDKQLIIEALQTKLEAAQKNNIKVEDHVALLHHHIGKKLTELFDLNVYTVRVDYGQIQFINKDKREAFKIRVSDERRFRSRGEVVLTLTERFKITLDVYSLSTDVEDTEDTEHFLAVSKVGHKIIESATRLLIRSHYKEVDDYKTKNGQSVYSIEREIAQFEKEIRNNERDKVLKVGTVLKFSGNALIYYSNQHFYRPTTVTIEKANPKSYRMKFVWGEDDRAQDVVTVRLDYAREIADSYLKSLVKETTAIKL